MLLNLYSGFLVAVSSIFMSNVYSQSTDCGYMSREKSIKGEWPWMAAITGKIISTPNDTIFCNGFLIDRRHVLTTAYCLARMYELEDITAHIGKKNWTEGEEFKITCITKHPRYDSAYAYDDIAILTLSRDVNPANFTPICLPDDNLATKRLDGLTVAKASWGFDEIPKGRIFVQTTGLRIISNKDCNTILSPELEKVRSYFPGTVSSDMLCTVNPSDQWELCRGSYGAPLMYKDKRNNWIAIGMSIFRFKCRAESPYGYIKISEYLQWIEETTKNGEGECTGYNPRPVAS